MNFDLQSYIQPGLLVLIPVLYVIGMVLKKSAAPDKWIPLVLIILGIFFAVLSVIAGGAPFTTAAEIATAVFTGIVQGVLVAGATVLTNQVIKQSSEKQIIGTVSDEDAAPTKTTKSNPAAPRPPD